jgi:hypothetical protein
MYTYWDYKRKRWERDGGLRIDFLLLTAQSAKRLKDAGVDREVRGAEGASDHAPAWIILRDTKSRRTHNPIERGDRRGVADLGCNGRAALSSDYYSLSTATRSRIAHITAFRSQSFGAVARAPALSSAWQTCCCDSSVRVPCSLAGTR